MIMDENYQNLANAIIIRAAKDYRASRTYLRNHPKTDDLVATVKKQKELRKKRREKREALGLPEVKEPRTREEQQLSRIRYSEKMQKDTERFFRSQWFCQLSEADGKALLKKLEEEYA